MNLYILDETGRPVRETDLRKWGQWLNDNLSAHPLLAWPEWFDAQAKRANDLATEWEHINGYEGNEKRAGEIDKEWQKLLVEFIGEYQ
jgi:hypothetical protein